MRDCLRSGSAVTASRPDGAAPSPYRRCGGPARASIRQSELRLRGYGEAGETDMVPLFDSRYCGSLSLHVNLPSFPLSCGDLQSVSKGRQSSHAANDVLVVLAVLRLPSVGSDLLVSLNSPVLISEHSAAAADAGAGVKTAFATAPQLMAAVIRSLKVEDWGLFG